MLSNVLNPDTLPHREALVNLGLKSEWLDMIGVRILAAYRQATPHDAANAAGSYAYFAAVRAVREILCPEGWQPQRQHNLEITKHLTKEAALIISSGDKNTGMLGGDEPKTKNSKGAQTQKIVVKNLQQLNLFPFLDPLKNEARPEYTWILLYHIDNAKSEMRVEISLPVTIDYEDLRVVAWKQRIILPPLKFHPKPLPQKDELTPNIEIEVTRKV